MEKLCQDRSPDWRRWYCTKPKNHEGDHVATVGPWTPDAHVKRQWPRKQEERREPVQDR